MRVQVTIQAAFPELAKDLGRIPPRERAERVRLLAGIGLAVLKGGLCASGQVRAEEEGALAREGQQAEAPPPTATRHKRDKLAAFKGSTKKVEEAD